MIVSKLNAENTFIFLTGICCGYILFVLFTEKIVDPKKYGQIQLVSKIVEMNSSSQSVESVKKIRILCFLNTMPESYSKKAVHIRNTWHKHCDKLLFVSTLMDMNLGALGLCYDFCPFFRAFQIYFSN